MPDTAPPLLPQPRALDLDRRSRVRVSEPDRRTEAPRLPAQGYRLTIPGDGGVRVEAADDAGWFYALQTLGQLRRLSPDGAVPCGVIEDWPDLPVRGVMLDVSRCKVPTMATLLALVDRMASWKLNQLQLYTEHTFAYPGHEEVWTGSDPYDAEDLARLAEHCTDRHVELVANQNTLGHMERWLVHDRYASLGIARGVVRGPLGMPMPASTLDPADPGALALASEMLDTLTSALPGSRFHLGLDEPWDLPPSRWGEWGEWLRQLRALRPLADRQLLVWGDMPAAHPELLDALPDGVTVCEWGYEANHPFGARVAALARAEVPYWVCPGTSSWLSLVGRTSNAVENCRRAAEAGAAGAGGLLVTDWGDMGHLQHLPVSDAGLATAAAVSWCRSSNGMGTGTEELARLLDAHCYGDSAGRLGKALVRLGDLHLLQPLRVPNVSALVLPLYFPQLPVGHPLHGDLAPSHLHAVTDGIDQALDDLAKAEPRSEHGRLAVDELSASAELVRLCCLDAAARLAGDGTLASVPDTTRAQLSQSLGGCIETHRQRWLARNRAGGLEESCAWLEHLRHCYDEGGADDDWAGPLVARLRARDRRATP